MGKRLGAGKFALIRLILLAAITTSITILATSSPSLAQFADTMAVGPGVRTHNNNRIGNTEDGYEDETVNRFWPVGYFIYGPFQVNDKGLQFSVLQSMALEVYAVTNLHGEDYRAEGMESTSESGFAGFGVRVYPLSLYTMYDLENESEGQLSRALLQFPFKFANFLILPTLGATYYDRTYSNHYYGVSANEATANRPEYSGPSGRDQFFNLKIFWNFYDQWELYFMGEQKSFSEEITNSPTVKDEALITTVFGIDYKFF